MGLFNKQKKGNSVVSNLAKSITEQLGYPYQVFPKGTDYQLLARKYQEAVTRGRSAGFTPVFVLADPTLDEALGIMADDGYTTEETLKKGADAEAGKRFLEERFAEYFGDAKADFGTSFEEFVGEYSGEPERLSGFSSLFDFSGQTAEVILFEVPTMHPWEIAAYIPFGGWNECPAPDDMVNVLKYWFEKYGAVPAAITHDTLEMAVPAPVRASDALELAKEHYAFTPDRVDQGTESGMLSEVAECLKVSTVWYFWWD